MNLVGAEGRGESVWLGFFQYRVLNEFAALCDGHSAADGPRYRAEAERLVAKLEAAWDGEWYRRGYYDDGSPLGAAENDACRIDSIAQSWAVLSGAAPRARAERALDAARSALLARGPRLLLLLHPPFDRTAQEPDISKVTHRRARKRRPIYSRRGLDGDGAGAAGKWRRGGGTFPHAESDQPHPHTGRSGALSRRALCGCRRRICLRTARRPSGLDLVHGIGGLDVPRRPGKHPRVAAPRRGLFHRPLHSGIVASFEIRWRVGAPNGDEAETIYEISVSNPDRRCRGVASAELDGGAVAPGAIPLLSDGGTHRVRVVLGGVQ